MIKREEELEREGEERGTGEGRGKEERGILLFYLNSPPSLTLIYKGSSEDEQNHL